MLMIDVPYFKQDTDYTCGPTALQMLLAYYGVKNSEANLSALLETDREQGTRREAMYEVAVRLGFHCYVNNQSTVAELEFLLALNVPPIVRFLEREENIDHYGVVVGVTDDSVLIHDPWSGPRQQFAQEDFLQRWTCGVIGNCNQWLLGISKEPFPLGRQFHPHV